MNIAFRADASKHIGTGHIMRCINLATGLRRKGANVTFICRKHEGNLIGHLADNNFPVIALSAPTTGEVSISENYGQWLGATQLEDAEETMAMFAAGDFEWLVVDHYGLGFDWEKTVGSRVNSTMVIDDLANRKHACNILLDQNFCENADRYAPLVPKDCSVLLGPSYALINDAFASTRRAPFRRGARVQRIFVFFGGSDPHNMTGLAIDALKTAGLTHMAIDVVVGLNNPHRDTIKSKLCRFADARLHDPMPTLADLIAHSDVAIGAGGTTTWERMCLGTPSIVVSIAENQRAGCKALARAGLIRYIGHFNSISIEEMADAIVGFVADTDALERLSRRGQELVDGLGVSRTIATMLHVRGTTT